MPIEGRNEDARAGRTARPLARAHMPTGFDISLHAYTQGRSVRVPSELGPRRSMRGFDGYANIVDYIVRITHRIWEGEPRPDGSSGRDVDYIGDTYAPDSRVFDDYGLQHGNAKIITDTHGTTGAFPDIVLDAEEVIWAGDDAIGYHTSHLVRLVGTHTGGGRYGEPTGRRFDVPVIANCVALENDIFLEHVLYNSSAMLAQLGRDPMEEAEKLVADPPAGWPRSPETWDALRREGGPERPLREAEPVGGFDPDAFARDLHAQAFAGEETALRAYAPDFSFEGTTNRAHQGRDAHAAYHASLRECFPDLAPRVDETYWMGNEDEGWLIATRWSAEATHRGGSLYGTPTGARVQIWGITQQRVESGSVVSECQLFNELDVMMQIAAARRSA